MARVGTIIVGGGVGATSPFTVNGIPYVAAADPPSISTTAFFTIVPSGATRAVIIGTDPQAAATERLRMNGGMISEGAAADTFLAGRLATAGGARSVSIGTSTLNASFTDAVNVGNTNTVNANNQVLLGSALTPNVQNDIIIGRSLSTGTGSGVAIGGGLTGGGSAKSVCIGGSITTGSGSNVAILGTVSGGNTGHVAIGGGTTSTTAASIAIGSVSITGSGSSIGINPSAVASVATLSASQCIALGFGFSITHADVIALGRCTSFATNTFQVGGHFSLMNTFLIGGDDTEAAAVNVAMRLSNATGTDIAGGSLTVQAGRPTGAGAGGSIIFQTALAGAGGTTLRALRTSGQFQASATAADTDFLLWDVDTGLLKRVSVGAAGSGGVGFKLLRIAN